MDSLSCALGYHDCGFSVFPLRPKSKRPLMRWARYQEERADKATICQWYSDWPNAGVAIIAGEVSGGLVVLDVDNYDFVNWLLEKDRVSLLNTWVVKTGSGKLHVYFRSHERCHTTKLYTGDTFLADIRADGQGSNGPSYLAAPPTVHPDTDVPYEHFLWWPGKIRSVQNGVEVMLKMADKFSGSARVTAYEALVSEPVDLPDIPDIPKEKIKQQLAAERKISGKVRRAIVNDAAPGEGEWPNVATHSEIDFAVSCSLLDAGWSKEDIQAVFHYLPIGANHYRDPSRPGKDYLARTISHATEKSQKKSEAARISDGENFKILRVNRLTWLDPTYELSLTNENNTECSVTIDHDDLFSELAFRKKIGRVMGEIPHLRPEHSGNRKKFEAFANVLLQMAATESVPESATAQGYFRSELATRLRELVMRSRGKPLAPEEIDILWADNTHVYVRGHKLVNHLNRTLNVSPQLIWETFRLMGGSEQTARYGERDEYKEAVWVLDRSLIER